MERMNFSLGASIVDLRSYDQSLLKQCRSVSELHDHTAMDGTNSRKLSRTDSYLSCRQQQSNDSSMSPDENPISQLGSNSNDQHLIMSSPGGYLNQVSAAAMRQLLPYQQQQQQQQLYSFRQTQGQSFGTLAQQYNPFTAPQWAELEQQALIFKYMMARVRVPPELFNPIRSSVAAAAIGPHNLFPSCSIGGSWGGFQLGVSSSPLDVEPGRCRRTDGKKWRCSRPVVPEQKYCERHIHRGRDRSKKAQEAAAAAAAQSRNGVGTGAGLLKSTTSHPAFQSTMKGNFNGGGASIGGKMFATSSMPGMVEAGGAAGGESQLPSTLSASQSDKDQRFSMSKAHPEQLVFSEVSGSTRELAAPQGHPSHLNCSSKLSSATMSMIPTTGNMQQHFGNQQAIQQQQYKSMMGYDSGPSSMKELTTSAPEWQQQQHGVSRSPLIRGIERKPEALRHFFDDWPRASMAQSSALSWSDTDDSHAKLNSSSTTQLSGSRHSSEYDETTANARAESAMFSPLKLGLEDTNSEVGLNEEEDGADPYTSMGLPNVRDRATWFGNANLGDASGSNPTSAGGPLAVALQNPSNAKATKIGFNLLGGGRNLVASPTGVLQFSDCSSSASSPGSVRTEANNPH